MAKAIPRTGLRRNVRIGARKIPKGVIDVQASFNNTFVTVMTKFRHPFTNGPKRMPKTKYEEKLTKGPTWDFSR